MNVQSPKGSVVNIASNLTQRLVRTVKCRSKFQDLSKGNLWFSRIRKKERSTGLEERVVKSKIKDQRLKTERRGWI